MLCVGLLYAGAAAFTLVYASCAPLVSAIGAAAGTLIRREQWLAIALATLGLALYELACKGEGRAAADARLWGSLLAFLGSVGHSGMFVMAEHARKTKARRQRVSRPSASVAAWALQKRRFWGFMWRSRSRTTRNA